MQTISNEDIKWCAESYCNFVKQKTNILSLSVEESILNLKQQEFISLYKVKNKPVAFISGCVTKQQFSKNKIFNQNFYYTELKGYSAYVAQKVLHQRMIEYASRRHIKTILSAGSYFDERNVFAKMLEKQGWIRHGYLAIYQL